jgi:hypothetical protein
MKLVIPDTPNARVSQPVPLTDFFTWARDLVGAEGEVTEDRTESGWPLFLVRTPGAGGWRVVALYRFFDHVAAATVEAVSAEKLPSVEETLRRGYPGADDAPVDLADLYR